MSVFLGIDIGTSGTKTLAVREDGAILASASAEYPLSTPHPGWSEQDPQHWWVATVATVREVLAKGRVKPGDVKGIGLSGRCTAACFSTGTIRSFARPSSGTTSAPPRNVPRSNSGPAAARN